MGVTDEAEAKECMLVLGGARCLQLFMGAQSCLHNPHMVPLHSLLHSPASVAWILLF